MSVALEKIEATIQAHRKKLEQLKAKKIAIESRQKIRQKQGERKQDTRRKILIGALILEKMEKDEELKQKVTKELDQFLTRKTDRELFALSPLPVAPLEDGR